jgi:hypothetical protein
MGSPDDQPSWLNWLLSIGIPHDTTTLESELPSGFFLNLCSLLLASRIRVIAQFHHPSSLTNLSASLGNFVF